MRLESLAATLAGTLPAANDAPLARALLGLLASHNPVIPTELAACTGRSDDEVSASIDDAYELGQLATLHTR